MKYLVYALAIFFSMVINAQVMEVKRKDAEEKKEPVISKTLYGTASYYADKFNGRETANGEIYDSKI